MLTQALIFILESVVNLFVLVVLMRFLLQLSRAPYKHPLSQFVNALTNFAVLPLRRLVPGFMGLDFASLIVAWLAELLLLFAVGALQGFPFVAAGAGGAALFVLLALLRIARFIVYIYIGVILIQAILSWVNPHNPLTPLLDSMSRPILKPIQRRMPLIGGVDLSPLVALLLLQLILIVPLAWFERQIGLGFL